MKSYKTRARVFLATAFAGGCAIIIFVACSEKPAPAGERSHHELTESQEQPGVARHDGEIHRDEAAHGDSEAHHDDEHSDHDDEAHHDDEHGDHNDGHAGHDHHHAPRSVGPGMAVIAADEELGVELAPAALERLGVRFGFLQDYRRPAGAERDYRVPAECVVFFENDAWIFLRDANRRIRPYAVRVAGRTGAGLELSIVESDFAPSQMQSELVIQAAPLVRLAYLEAFGASGSGHGH